MAIMIGMKPEEYVGESVVWESLSKNLPNDVVVYTHKEVLKGDECDFALLVKNRGILIIEVKGWQAKYIFEVNSNEQIILTSDAPNEKKVQGSPRAQARKYRFQWLNFLKDRLGYSPLVLHMVCYPFISEEEYHEKRLDTISDRNITLFSEDIKNPVKLGQKIDSWFNVKKGISTDPFDDTCMALVRQCFEPDYQVNTEVVKQISNHYSILKIYPTKIPTEDINALTDAYFAGSKIIIFTPERDDLAALARNIQSGLKSRNLTADHGKICLSLDEDEDECLYSKGKDSLRLFNFEAYWLPSDISHCQTVTIIEGKATKEESILLKRAAELTGFNEKQFGIEHADINSDILVRAGAGTGKTYSMVSRIAFLCNTKQMAVSNLVDDVAMVTFTNDAADNMKSRLKAYFMSFYLLTRKKRYLHDIEAVDLMQISTIHKFAKSIIQASSVEYGLGHDFSITSGSYTKELVYEKYLDKYLLEKKENNPNISRDLRMPVHRFRKLLMNFSKQLYDKSCDIKQIVPDEFGTFDEMPFFNEIIEKVIIPAEKEYSATITSRNRIDLKECMILLNKAVNGPYKDKCDLKYKYLFIDEFQDTDDVQIDSFLKLQEIIKGMHLFIVGDIKQSIYRFRGATDSAFKLIQKAGTYWDEHSLNVNYRSDRRLLERFDQIFTKMGQNSYLKFMPGNDRDTLTSTIDAGASDEDLVKEIDYSSDDPNAFMDILFDEIERQKDIIEKLSENRKLSDEEKTVAILVRENWQITEILKESRTRKIFIETQIGGDLYQLDPALDLYKLVLALISPRDPVVLYNLISSNYVNVGIDIQGLHGRTKKEKAEILTDVLNRYYFEKAGRTWDEIIKDTHIKPVLVLLRNIYEDTKPWVNFGEDEDAQRFYQANYELVIEKVIKAFSVDYLTLNVFERCLHINILTKQEELSRNIENSTGGIRILCTTVHKAKGLEYGCVIIPYATADISSMNKAQLDAIYSRENGLAFGIRFDDKYQKYFNSNYDQRSEKTQRIQEESRVLYVALTRAIRSVTWFKDTAAKHHISWQMLMEG